jgi:hypothetical protein
MYRDKDLLEQEHKKFMRNLRTRTGVGRYTSLCVKAFWALAWVTVAFLITTHALPLLYAAVLEAQRL